MKPTKQTVYLPIDSIDCDYIVKWYDDSYENDVKKEEGYFFTPEQLNEYTQGVIKQALETAADKAEIEDIGGVGRDGEYHEHNIVDEKSITNTFEETYKKFEV